MGQELAQRSVTILADLLANRLTGSQEQAANELYSVVSRRLRPANGLVLEAFERSPSSIAARNELVATIVSHLVQDAQLFHYVQGLVQRTNAASVNVSASGRSTAAGRDVNQNRKTSYGGLVVAGLAIAAIVAILLVGRVVVNVVSDALVGGGLNGDSTCTDYLASSDAAAKQSVMKELYLERNKPELAADPFIIQNTEYYCGKRPNDTLATVATRRG